MLFLLYGLSALLCIAALVAKLYFGGFAFPLALLIPAFVFLVVGMLKQQRDERPVEFADLEEWHREELKKPAGEWPIRHGRAPSAAVVSWHEP